MRTRYIIVGAGAVGGTIGGLLTRSGVPTVLVARGEHARALREYGLHLRLPDEELRLPVTVATSPDDVTLTSDDVLVFTTKTQQLDAALTDWVDAPVDGGGTAGERLPAVTVTNGVAAEDKALRHFERVFGATVYTPASHLAPGEVFAHSAPVSGIVHIGRWPSGALTSDDDALLGGLRDAWTPAGVLVNVTDDPAGWKYAKLLANLGNASNALLGPDEDDAAIVAAARAEGRAVFEYAGIKPVPGDEVASWMAKGLHTRAVPGFDGTHGSSTWQSLKRGTGNIETDYLNGEIVRLAHVAGRRAPVNAALARLARIAARSGRGAGTYTAGELAAAIGL